MTQRAIAPERQQTSVSTSLCGRLRDALRGKIVIVRFE